MLKHPFIDVPYAPKIRWLLGGIEIYDREETLGELLWQFNPNDPEDRRKIINEHILASFDDDSYRHRYLLVQELGKSLLDTQTDFAVLFIADPDEYESLAWEENEIEDPRAFFADIHAAALQRWDADLEKAAAEDQATW